MNTKTITTIAIGIVTSSFFACYNNDLNQINQRVEELIQYIPDHQMLLQEAQQAYTPEYWNLLSKAWQIPTPQGKIGDKEFLYYFIESNDGCNFNSGKHQIVPIETKITTPTTAFEIFDYIHPQGNKERHKICLIKHQDKWIIDDFDSTKSTLIKYIDNHFITPDLAFMQVKGHVKSVIYKNKRKAFFNEQGTITQYFTEFASTHTFNDGMFDEVEDNGDVQVTLTRNDNGYIIATYDGPGGSDFFEYDTITMQLTLSGSGDGGYWTASKYGINQNGEPTVTIVESDLGEETESTPSIITYDKIDSHGNWLKCGNQERTIEYYE